MGLWPFAPRLRRVTMLLPHVARPDAFQYVAQVLFAIVFAASARQLNNPPRPPTKLEVCHTR